MCQSIKSSHYSAALILTATHQSTGLSFEWHDEYSYVNFLMFFFLFLTQMNRQKNGNQNLILIINESDRTNVFRQFSEQNIEFDSIEAENQKLKKCFHNRSMLAFTVVLHNRILLLSWPNLLALLFIQTRLSVSLATVEKKISMWKR